MELEMKLTTEMDFAGLSAKVKYHYEKGDSNNLPEIHGIEISIDFESQQEWVKKDVIDALLEDAVKQKAEAVVDFLTQNL